MLSKADADDIARLDFSRRLNNLIIDGNAAAGAGFISNRSSFNDPGNFQVFTILMRSSQIKPAGNNVPAGRMV